MPSSVYRASRSLSTLVLFAGLLSQPAFAGELLDYLKKPEPKFAWKLKEKITGEAGVVYDLQLTSQVWHDVTWEHQLQVYQPKGVEPNKTMLVYNTGGSSNPEYVAFGMSLARKIKAPVAILFHIPNQPLLDDKTEDALIAETFVRYLKTKDGSWPLLFPMVKSVVKAMDALQAFSKEEWKEPVKSFIISGASKRGWTTWLTGASDPRVLAIAPLVIDTLNMAKQMDYQKESFGAYSDMVTDYTERGLIPMPKGEDAKNLWQMVDPFFYREKLAMPKLLIHGNNDPYWTVDATNLYWDELKGEKYLAYVANAGHNLEQHKPGAPVKDKGDRSRAVNVLAAFARSQTAGKPMPKLTWKHDDADGKLRLKVEADPAPTAARLWVASSKTRDFRDSRWKDEPAKISKTTVLGEIAAPLEGEGCKAFYAELDYEIDGIRYHLSTQLRVAGKAKTAQR